VTSTTGSTSVSSVPSLTRSLPTLLLTTIGLGLLLPPEHERDG
jgi:hypothetical protein